MADVIVTVDQPRVVDVIPDSSPEQNISIGDKLFIKGDKGDTGDTGTTFTPSVSPSGDLSWSNDGGKPNPATVNIKGDKGDTGNTGQTGRTPEIFTRAVTLEPGSAAYADTTGTVEQPLITFGIPRGDTGAAGSDGKDGSDGVSPEITVTDITGGHRVTITDADHPFGQTFDVMDGEPGTTDYNDLENKPTIPSTAAEVGALPDDTKYALSAAVGGSAKNTEGIPYGVVDGTSTATKFTATVPGITELKNGTVVMLKNGVITSAAGFTININGLGAKPAYSNMAAATAESTMFNVNYTMLFVYDETRIEGGCWILYRGYNSDNNTIGYILRTNSSGLPLSDKVYRYRLCFTSADGMKYVPSTTSTSTNATSARTVNQRAIDPFGKIIYYAYTTAIDAGSRLGAAYQQTQGTLVLGYAFNVNGNETLSSWKPVYLKCAPQADGSAIMDSATPIVQALPTTNDGKIYIFLGIAYDTTHIELHQNHPVYYHNGTGLRMWTGGA